MATLNYTDGDGLALANPVGSPIKLLRNLVDFKKTPSGAGDVVQVINIPADCIVLRAGHKTLRVEGGTAAGTLGDGADVDGYLTASNFNALATQMSTLALTEAAPNTVTGYSGGKFYSAADTIDIVTTQALDLALVEFYALVVELQPHSIT